MNRNLLCLTSVWLLASACTSHVSYKEADFSGNRTYRNHGSTLQQLNENEVLGLNHPESVKDQDIQRILDETRTFRLAPGSTLLLVQSGAATPDSQMVEQLAKHFQVVPQSGIQSQITQGGNNAGLSKALRLQAAHSKAETILVYWGNLELKRDDLPTGIVSWVPVVDFMVPDEYHRMRMSLKVALIDVRTGQWTTFRTEPVEQQILSTRYARAHDQKWPLESTKRQLYAACVQKLLNGYTLAGN